MCDPTKTRQGRDLADLDKAAPGLAGQPSRMEARARLDEAACRVMRLLTPVTMTYLVVDGVVDLLFVRRWSPGAGAFVVPLALLYVGVLVADRGGGWDQPTAFRAAVVLAAALLGALGAVLTGRF